MEALGLDTEDVKPMTSGQVSAILNLARERVTAVDELASAFAFEEHMRKETRRLRPTHKAETPFPYQLITCASGLFADYSRKHVLKSLRDHFDDAGETLCVQIVCGVAGIGKTRLIAEYAVKNKARYHGGVFYLYAESQLTFQQSVKDNLSSLEIFYSGVLSEDYERFLSYTRKNPHCLIIIDNDDSLSITCQYLPPSPVHILITTRCSKLRIPMQLACHQSIQLPVLDRVSALQLLFGCVGEVDFQRREQIELKYAELIVGHTGLDGYPLALAYVASFVRSQGQGYSLRNFWEMMNANKKYISTGPKRLQEFLKMCRLTKIESKLMGVGVNDLDSLRELIPSDLECTDIGPLDKRILLTARDELTNASSFSVWRLDIRAIWKSSLLAQRLLCFASLLPARDIPENLLLSCVDRMEMQCEPLAVRNVFDLIERHSLLTREGIQVYNENVYSGHLLVLGDIRQFAADEQEDLSIYLSVLCESLCSLLPLSVDVRQWLGLNDPKVQRYSLHLFHIANLCAEEKLLSAPPCQMLLDLACILGIRTRNIETATTLCQVRLQHAWSAGVLRTVATALVDMGRCFSLSYEKEPAMAHFCEALRLLEGQCMNNLDEWAIAVLEIARGHWDLGDGTTMMEQATKVKVVLEENQCTDRHLYAEALTNISMYWWHIGNYSEAKMTSLKAVAVYEKCLPLNHSLLAAEMDNLGSYCTAQAKFKDAKEWLERSIRIKPNCLPSSHPRIVNTLRLLGEMYNESGCFDEAERILREADRLASASYSTETQEAAWNRVTLGQCLSLKGKGKEGEQLVRQGVIQIMKMYGDKHLRTGLAQCMLGSCLTICGKTSEAETNLRDALQVVRQNLPENHHHIGTVWHELGQCYQRQSKYDEAKAAFTNALLIKKRSFVDDHPSLIQTHQALSKLQASQADHDQLKDF